MDKPSKNGAGGGNYFNGRSDDGFGGGYHLGRNGSSGHSQPAQGGNMPSVRRALTPDVDEFTINLTYEGHLQRHQVSQHMFVEKLVEEASILYQLNAADLVLMLFGMNPQTLLRRNRLSDPPRVGPDSTVLIFNLAGHANHVGRQLASPPAQTRDPNGADTAFVPATNFLGSKILSNFKLPKFDGNARYWKTWDKNFIRFLSIHQLDFVIEESFLNFLPLTPRNFEANKMVYYILEDAVTTGSLAAKYVRQAAKWNGNEAYMKLHNGYVFSGPQTMALLLAELVNIRFKADESASGFCLRM
jgi:hypothetical protein